MSGLTESASVMFNNLNDMMRFIFSSRGDQNITWSIAIELNENGIENEIENQNEN